MQKKYLLIPICIFIIFSYPVLAKEKPEEILNAIIKVRATIPQDASTARVLGTEREGNGVVIDDQGHILTIGYLILEAEAIEVIGARGDPVKASFVAYDYTTGFGILRADPPLSVRPLKLGQSSQLKEGDPVLMVGSGGAEAVLGSPTGSTFLKMPFIPAPLTPIMAALPCSIIKDSFWESDRFSPGSPYRGWV
jgi:hypothetical protein